MKKSLIATAGVAAFAVTAVPMAAFALNTELTDTLKITIDDNCNLAYGTTPHSAETGHGTWTGNELSRTMTAGTTDTALGTTNFNVICNNTTGYEVTMDATGLTSAGGDTISYAAQEVSTSASTWAVNNGTTYVADEGVVKSSDAETSATGDNFSVTYSVGLVNNQAAGVYEGSVLYTLDKQ